MPVRVLIADDHALSRRGIRSVLGESDKFQIVGEAMDGHDVLEKAKQLRPDLILMDISMPGQSGLEATKLIKEQAPNVKIVMLSISDDVQDFFESIKNGAQGYLLKNMDTEYWIDYLTNIAEGGAPVPRSLANKILAQFAAQSSGQAEVDCENLSNREKEVLLFVSQGLSNKEIGEKLYISESTVKNHMRNMMDKLHLRKRGQLIAFAYQNRLIKNRPSKI
ncbi:MAG: response regulator transcription factor [Candidatus Adiutrix sp.]|jgi:DNA-binding NarL/FixJ family response regulator|nr:response regulator transcription factor [Candidatus Adiutrix sp.]